jgi:hypothetical protein
VINFPGVTYNKKYFDIYFCRKKDTEYFLDGSPLDIYEVLTPVISSIKTLELFNEIKYITFLRDPLERVTSLGNTLIGLSDDYQKPSFMNDDGKINEEDVLIWIGEALIKPYLHLKTITQIISIDNIFIGNFEEIGSSVKKVLDFLELDYEDLPVHDLNKSKNQDPTFQRIIDENRKDLEIVSHHIQNKIEREYQII